MSLLFGKKENEVISSFKRHLQVVQKVVESTFNILEAQESERESIVKDVRKYETEADSIRRDTETMMYSGAFLAHARGDMLGLIESVDKIANKAETVADVVYLQNLKIPNSLLDKYMEEYKYSLNAYKALEKSIETLFSDTEKTKEFVLEVEKWENTGDKVERSLIVDIFKLDLELAWKIQLRELALQIGDIADRSEDASDRIEIIILKTSA